MANSERTIVKQMKIIHQNGYSQDELSLYRTIVFRNLLDSAKAITDAIEMPQILLQVIRRLVSRCRNTNLRDEMLVMSCRRNVRSN